MVITDTLPTFKNDVFTLIFVDILKCLQKWWLRTHCQLLKWRVHFNLYGVGGAVRFFVVGTIGKEERLPRGQLWMEQYLISLKYWPI